jgi:hypothetical protein
MRNTRKLGLALALAAALVTGGAVVQARAADTAVATTCGPAQTYVCDVIARTIQYLESLTEGPLRDALLARARALQVRYCTTC